jgi:initiation factor 1A
MVNTIGGKGYKKGKKGGARNKNPATKFDTNDGYHHYGQVIQILGGNRLSIRLTNDEIIQAVIPGKFMNKVWFRKDDYVVLMRENNFYDVVQKITSSEVQSIASNSLVTKLDKDDYNIYQTELVQNDSDEEDLNETLIKESTKIKTKTKTTPVEKSASSTDSTDSTESSDDEEPTKQTKQNKQIKQIKDTKKAIPTYVDSVEDIKNLMNL